MDLAAGPVDELRAAATAACTRRPEHGRPRWSGMPCLGKCRSIKQARADVLRPSCTYACVPIMLRCAGSTVRASQAPSCTTPRRPARHGLPCGPGRHPYRAGPLAVSCGGGFGGRQHHGHGQVRAVPVGRSLWPIRAARLCLHACMCGRRYSRCDTMWQSQAHRLLAGSGVSALRTACLQGAVACQCAAHARRRRHVGHHGRGPGRRHRRRHAVTGTGAVAAAGACGVCVGGRQRIWLQRHGAGDVSACGAAAVMRVMHACMTLCVG